MLIEQERLPRGPGDPWGSCSQNNQYSHTKGSQGALGPMGELQSIQSIQSAQGTPKWPWDGMQALAAMHGAGVGRHESSYGWL